MCTYAKSNRLLVLGMMALVVANVVSYVIRRKLALPESVADPVTGFLFGVAIATTLLGVRRQVRARTKSGPRR
jgi:hypothetical protein